jgi:predicted  nucleic acid-binding Zn-ribbon protein
VDLKKHEEEQQDFMKRALATLDTLDERAEKIDVRLGQIETRMRELEEEEEKERKKRRR